MKVLLPFFTVALRVFYDNHRQLAAIDFIQYRSIDFVDKCLVRFDSLIELDRFFVFSDSHIKYLHN